MSEEEKQAIEILRSFEPNDLVECAIYLQALEKLTNLIDKLQKENKELKNQEATQKKINELLVQRYSNSIPVQKVKDKIEELQKTNFNDYTKKQDGNNVKMEILYEFKKMLESEE